MNHTVDTADIDERTIAGHGLDDTVILIADLHLVPDGLCLLAALFLSDGTDGTDNALAAAVDLGDLNADLLLEQLVHVSLLGQAGLGCGNEYANALDVDDYAALVDLGNGAFEELAALDCFFDHCPALCGIKTLLGEHNGAFNIVNADNNCFDGIADLDSVFDLDAVIGKLGGGNEARILGADIDTDFSAGNSNDIAGYLISIIYSLDGFLQHFVEGHLLLFCRDCISFDFFAHRVTYLLNYPRRRGRSCRDPDGVGAFEPVRIQLTGIFDKLNVRANLAAYHRKVDAVRAVFSAYNDHCIALCRQFCGFFLTHGCCTTYCIKDLKICTSFF